MVCSLHAVLGLVLYVPFVSKRYTMYFGVGATWSLYRRVKSSRCARCLVSFARDGVLFC